MPDFVPYWRREEDQEFEVLTRPNAEQSKPPLADFEISPLYASGEQAEALMAEPEPEEEPEPEVDIEELLDEARGMAYAQGLAEGREARQPEVDSAQEELDKLHEQIQELQQKLRVQEDLTEAIEAFHGEVLSQSVSEVAAVIQLLTHRILGQSARALPGHLEELIRQTLEQFPQDEVVHLIIHPEDQERVEAVLPATRKVVIQTDEELSGGCRIESHFGSIDASLETALEQVDELIQAWMSDAQG